MEDIQAVNFSEKLNDSIWSFFLPVMRIQKVKKCKANQLSDFDNSYKEQILAFFSSSSL